MTQVMLLCSQVERHGDMWKGMMTYGKENMAEALAPVAVPRKVEAEQ